uniref:Bacterial Ig-like domain-containing protein n=1 Tax=Curvibacter symbiont subsp. Hydra magnipapillata TaxID=667019 RepID=C9Y8W7_CURXX|nr:hypothetical protein Csp_A05680 [Curvibacter putative symbiont of Hydra magnipapillata]
MVVVDLTANAPTAAVLDPGSDTGTKGDGTTTVTTPRLSGSGGEAGATIQVYAGTSTTPVATGTVNADGTWAILPGLTSASGGWASALTTGVQVLTVKQTDLAGNTSNASAPLSLTIAAPVTVNAPTGFKLTGTTAVDTGFSQTDNITSATSLTFTGSGAVAGGTVEVWQFDPTGTTALNRLGTSSTTTSGTWTTGVITSNASVLPESSSAYVIKARVLDAQGNASAFTTGISGTDTLSLTIDRTAPVTNLTFVGGLSVDSGRNSTDGVTNESTQTLTVSGATPGSRVQIFNGTSTTALATLTETSIPGTFSGQVTLPAGFTYSLRAAEVDTAGNVGSRSTVALAVTVDQAAPSALTINTPPTSGAAQPTITGSGAEANAIIELVSAADGTTVLASGYTSTSGTWSVQLPNQATGSDQIISFKARQKDLAGNASDLQALASSVTISATSAGVTANTTVVPQLAAPVLKASSDSGAFNNDGITNATQPVLVISGVSSSVTAGTQLKAYNGLVEVPGTFSAGTGAGVWEFTPTTPLAAANYSFNVTQTVGSTTSAVSPNLAVTVDTASAAPVLITTTAAVVGTNTSVTVTGEAGGIIEVIDSYNNGTTTVSSTVGRITLTSTAGTTVPVTLPGVGTHTLTLRQTDLAGNTKLVGGADALSTGSVVYAVNPAPATAPVLNNLSTSDDTFSITGSQTVNSQVVNYGTDNTTKNTTVTVSGSWANNGDAIQLFQLQSDGSTYVAVGTPITVTAGAWSTTVNLNTNATTTLKARASNPMGSSDFSANALTITHDSLAPTVPTVGLAAASDSGVQGDNRTNSATITLTGTAEAGALIRVYTGSAEVNSGTVVYADSQGNWSKDVPNISASTTYVVTATDKAGNVSSTGTATGVANTGTGTSYAVIFDNTAPTSQLIITGGANISTSLLPSVAGTGAEVVNGVGAFVEIYSSNNDLLGRTQANSAGAWSLQLTSLDKAGSYAITAKTRDAAGNLQTTGTATSTLTVADNTPIVAPTTTALPNITLLAADDTGTPGDNATVLARPRLTGTGAVPAAVVQVFKSGSLIGSGVVNGDGTWTITPTVDLTTGSNSLTATQQLAGQSVSASTSYSVTINTPTASNAITITANIATDDKINATELNAGVTLSGATTATSTSQVSLTLTNKVTGASFTVNPTTVSSSTWSYSLNTATVNTYNLGGDSQLGNFNVKVTQTTSADSVSATRDLTIGTTVPVGAPGGPTLAPASNSGNLNDNVTNITTPTFTGTAVAGSRVNLYYGGTNLIGTGVADTNGVYTIAYGAGLSSAPAALTDGVAATTGAGTTYSITAKYADAANNNVASTASTALSMAVDLASGKPVVNNTSANTTTINPILSGTGEGRATIQLFDNGSVTPFGTTQVRADGTWSFQSTLDAGSHNIIATQTDVAGNVASAGTTAVNLTLSGTATTAPTFPTLAANQDTAGADTTGTTTDQISTVSKPSFNGTSTTAGATLQLWANGLLVASTTASSTANVGGTFDYAFTPASYTTALTNVNQLRVVQVVNGVSSTPSASYTWTVDNFIAPSTPVLTSSSTDSYGNIYSASVASGLTPTLTGTTEAGARVQVLDNGAPVATVTANASGVWTYAFTSLASGNHSITTLVTDLAGNQVTLNKSAAYVFKTLTATPSTPTVQVLSGGDSGRSSSDGVTNVTSQTFKGTVSVTAGQDAPTVNIYDTVTVNGTPTTTLLGTATADNTGAWVYTATLATGSTHTITARAKDLSGNLSSATPVTTLTVDTTAPSTPAAPTLGTDQDTAGSGTTGTTGDGITRITQPVLTGTVEADTTVELYDNGNLVGSLLTATGSYSISPSAPLAQGAHSLTVQVVDAAGNRSAASPATAITVDSTISPISFFGLPSANVLFSSGGVITTTSTSPTLQGFGEAGATVTVFNGSNTVGTATVGTDGKWTVAPSSALTDNTTYTLTAQQVDRAGNTSTATAPLTLRVETGATAPTLSLQTSSDTGTLDDGITARSTPTVVNKAGQGTATAGDTVNLYNDTTGAVLGSGVADANGNWAITLTSALVDNTYSLIAKVGAYNGGTTLGTLGLKIDSQPDAAPTGLALAADSDTGTLGDNLTNLSSPVIAGGGATAGATVRLLEGSTLLGQGVADGAGNWRVQSATLSAGAHTLTAVQVDAAGNVSGASNALVVTVDTAAAALSAPVLNAADDTGILDNRTSQSSLTVSGQGAEANAWVSVFNTANGVTTQLARVQAGADGKWSAALTGLPGSATGTAYSLTARQLDAAGNISAASTALALVVDNAAAAPTIALDSSSATNDTGTLGDGRTQNTRPVLKGTAEAGATVQVLLDAGNGTTTLLATVVADSAGAFSWTPGADLTQGTYRLLTRQTDVAGNTSVLSAAYSLLILPSTTVNTDILKTGGIGGGQLVDLNNDGLVDVMKYTTVAAQSVYLKTPTGLDYVQGPSLPAGFAPSLSSLVDLNNDGIMEVADPLANGATVGMRVYFWNSSQSTVSISAGVGSVNQASGYFANWLGNGNLGASLNGQLATAVANGKMVGVAGNSNSDRQSAAYDANGDGYLDVMYASNSGVSGLWINKGDGTAFTATGLLNNAGAGVQGHITTIDYNNDGVLDIFSGSRVTQGLGNGVYTNVTVQVGFLSTGSSASNTNAMVADVNADGWQDLLVWSQTYNFEVWLNVGGTFQLQTTNKVFDLSGSLVLDGGVGVAAVSAMDINGDRSLDLALSNSGAGIVSYNATAVAENTYLRIEVANSTGNTTLSTGAQVTLYDSSTGNLVATQLVGNNVLGYRASRAGAPYAEFFGLDPAKTYDVVVRYPGNDQGVTVVSGKSGLGTTGIAGSVLREIVDSQLTAVSPGGKDVITVAPENRSTATDGGNWVGTRYADYMVGDKGDDTFTPNGGNVGEAGDTIDLSNGGHDKVVFNTVLNTYTPANISGFSNGSFTQAGGNGDTINVSGLLTALGYTGARDAASVASVLQVVASRDLSSDGYTVSSSGAATHLMLQTKNSSGAWQNVALIKGAGGVELANTLTPSNGNYLSALMANGNLQLGQLSLGGTTPGITWSETQANSLQALYSDLTVLADGGTFSQDFSKGSLKVTLGDAYAEDRLSLVTTGLVSVSGSNVSYNGVVIGTVDSTLNGTAGQALQVNLAFAGTSLSKAEQAVAVQAVARAVQYQNNGNTPPDFYRDLTLQVSDGETTAKMVGQLTVTPQANTSTVAGKSVVSGTNAVDTNLAGTSGNDTIVGYGGPVINASTSSATGDTITGNGGRDTFVYRKGNVGRDTITDFAVYTVGNGTAASTAADTINVADLLQGYVPGTSSVNDFVRVVNNGSGVAQVQVDYNGKADGSSFMPYMVMNLTGVTLASTGMASFDALRDSLVAHDQLVLSSQQLTAQTTAMAKITAYAAGTGTLGVSDYVNAGVSGVSTLNLDTVNAKVQAAYVAAGNSASAVNDSFKVQDLVYPTITGAAAKLVTLTVNYALQGGTTTSGKPMGWTSPTPQTAATP